MWEKKRKDQSRTQDLTEFGFNNAYVSETLNLQQLRLSRYIKKYFYTCRTWSLTQNELPRLSITRVTTHSKREWQHTQNVSDNTLKTRSEHYSSKRSWAQQLKRMFSRRSRRIKLGEYKEARLSLNKDLANWVYQYLDFSLSLWIWLVSSLE
jgi:hypothetical protein